MAEHVEVLIPRALRNGGPMLQAIAQAAREYGHRVHVRSEYGGDARWLVLYGVGHPQQAAVRQQHVARGGRVLMWDAGYFDRAGGDGMLRTSIDVDHPHALLDGTPTDAGRWNALGLPLTEDADPNGPIILVGLGPKTRVYLPHDADWERRTFKSLQREHPDRRIVYRPKPKRPHPPIPCETDGDTPIARLLRGASLVVCRHSNVAVDATVTGVPIRCEDGAALWLRGKPYDRATRQDFLHRLAWWQWRPSEAMRAWGFLRDQLADITQDPGYQPVPHALVSSRVQRSRGWR